MLPDGNLDRKQLRDIIFADAKQRYWLESVLHPQIHDEILKQLHKLSSYAYCIVVIPLLIEAASYAFIDRILRPAVEPPPGSAELLPQGATGTSRARPAAARSFNSRSMKSCGLYRLSARGAVPLIPPPLR